VRTVSIAILPVPESKGCSYCLISSFTPSITSPWELSINLLTWHVRIVSIGMMNSGFDFSPHLSKSNGVSVGRLLYPIPQFTNQCLLMHSCFFSPQPNPSNVFVVRREKPEKSEPIPHEGIPDIVAPLQES
jgi:hypothetical protein